MQYYDVTHARSKAAVQPKSVGYSKIAREKKEGNCSCFVLISLLRNEDQGTGNERIGKETDCVYYMCVVNLTCRSSTSKIFALFGSPHVEVGSSCPNSDTRGANSLGYHIAYCQFVGVLEFMGYCVEVWLESGLVAHSSRSDSRYK